MTNSGGECQVCGTPLPERSLDQGRHGGRLRRYCPAAQMQGPGARFETTSQSDLNANPQKSAGSGSVRVAP